MVIPRYVIILTLFLVIYLPLPLISTTLSYPLIDSGDTNATTEDRFQIKQIYPTKHNGREWYIDMNDPRSDGLFFITSDKNITRQVGKDISWHVNHTSIRMSVDSPPAMQPWKNVEITGYVKIVSAVNNSNTEGLEAK